VVKDDKSGYQKRKELNRQLEKVRREIDQSEKLIDNKESRKKSVEEELGDPGSLTPQVLQDLSREFSELENEITALNDIWLRLMEEKELLEQSLGMM